MTRMFALFRALLTLLFLAACAGVPPQSVSLAPQVKAPTGNVGKGRTVAFRVVDSRGDKVIGYRSSDGSRSAPITVEGELSKSVGEAAVRTLSELGFLPAAYKDGAPLSLVITVRQLSYALQNMTVTKKMTVKCDLSARVTNGPSHWEGSYPITQEKEVVTSPDENANARFINDVLSESLSMLMSDPEMVQALAKENPVQGKTLKEE